MKKITTGLNVNVHSNEHMFLEAGTILLLTVTHVTEHHMYFLYVYFSRHISDYQIY